MEQSPLDKNRGGIMQMKRYEEMLVTGMLGTSRHNEPLQAVIENQLNESALKETNNSVLERNRALLQYIATIANSNSINDEFNYEFVESLVKGGADINIADQHEQTIFHEVARSWNTDIAQFLLDNGCNINKKDCYGRTPLHVAAAVDFVEMTEFLLENNANIDARTFGECQAPIHYASKNGATRSLRMLLGFNANIDAPDAKQRTPLQLAAEWTRFETAKVLIDEGAASCLLDSSGNSALSILIDRLPNLALEALNQLQKTDIITMKTFYYIQYLEASRQKIETKSTRTPLEAAVTTRKYEVVTHPVMQRLIRNKWIHFGRLSTIFDLLFHIIFGIAWTAFCLGTPADGSDLYRSTEARVWRSVVGSIILLMTFYDIGLHIHKTIKSRRSQANWIRWRTVQLEEDMKYCHPRWPQEQKYVKREIKRVRSLPLFDAYDVWFYLDWIILIVIVATIATHFVYYQVDSTASRYVYTRTISIVNLLVWLRLLKYVRPFPGIGTLVIILGETSGDFTNWAFLFFLLLLPFSAAFWINFGEISFTPVHGYETTGALLYSVFGIAVGDEFHFEELVKVDPVMSRILVALYVTAVTIVTLNLLIALLTDTFSRVYSNAVANTIMQRAIKVVEAERTLSKKTKRRYKEYMKLNCSPEVIDTEVDNWNATFSAEKSAEMEMSCNLKEVKRVLEDRFGVVYGKDKRSDFDVIIDDIKKLRMLEDELTNEVREISEMVNSLSGKPTLLKGHESRTRDLKERRTSRSSQKQEAGGFVTTLQHTAALLIPSWLTGRKEENRLKSNQRRQPDEKNTKTSAKEGRRRRRQRTEKIMDEEHVSSHNSNLRQRGRRTEKHTFSVGDRRKNTFGFSNQAFQNEPELELDRISLSSDEV